MSANLMVKRFEEINVFFMEDGWFNATSVAKKFGKRPETWLRTEEVQKLISKISITLYGVIEQNQIVIVKRGSPEAGGGTWMHPKLAVHFAYWLNVDFAVWFGEQVEQILHERSIPVFDIYQRQSFPVFQNEALGFTQCMSAEDSYCKANRVSFDSTIKEFCGLRNPMYIRQLTNMVFRIFTGFEVKDFRRGWGIARGSRLRTRLFVDSNLRRAIDDVEIQARAIIEEWQLIEFDDIYSAVEDVAMSIAAHCRAHRISLGRSVPINLRLVS